MMVTAHCYLSLIVATLLRGATGFVLPSSVVGARRFGGTTQLHYKQKYDAGTGWDSFRDMGSMVDMGEEQRKFRRTVYTHDDWKKHRSQDRFISYLLVVFTSGVYANMGREILVTTIIATFVVVYNAIVGGYTDLSGVQQAALVSNILPKLSLPLTAFTLTSPSLGLLLVFRTNSSYKRWDEARKNWGMNINHTRDLVRMANCFYDGSGVSSQQRADDLKHVALCTWAFVRSMKRHLSPEEEDEATFRAELYDKLPWQQAEMIIESAHRPNRALQDLSYAIDDLPMHFLRKNEIQTAATIFEDDLGSSERILTSPVPVFYARHLNRYLAVWLLLLPFGLYDTFASSWNHVAMIPAVAVISTMLFGIEEIGTQLEEPFTVLPMQAFCDKIYNWCMEIISWEPGDNGRSMKEVKEEHSFFTDYEINNEYEQIDQLTPPPYLYYAENAPVPEVGSSAVKVDTPAPEIVPSAFEAVAAPEETVADTEAAAPAVDVVASSTDNDAPAPKDSFSSAEGAAPIRENAVAPAAVSPAVETAAPSTSLQSLIGSGNLQDMNKYWADRSMGGRG